MTDSMKSDNEKYSNFETSSLLFQLSKKLQNQKSFINEAENLAKNGLKWKELVESRGLPWPYRGTIEVITGYEPPNPGSHQQVKDYLFHLGWKPDVFKEKTRRASRSPRLTKRSRTEEEFLTLLYDYMKKNPVGSSG